MNNGRKQATTLSNVPPSNSEPATSKRNVKYGRVILPFLQSTLILSSSTLKRTIGTLLCRKVVDDKEVKAVDLQPSSSMVHQIS